MKKLLFLVFLAIGILQSFTPAFGMRKLFRKMHPGRHVVQVHPQNTHEVVPASLSDLSDDAIRYVMLAMDFQALNQLAQTSHRFCSLAAQVFTMTTRADSPVRAIELAREKGLPVIALGIIDNVLKQVGEDGPNGIKRIARERSVAFALKIAAARGWILALYVLLYDVKLSSKITADGAKDAVIASYNGKHSDCTFVLMCNRHITRFLDLPEIMLILDTAASDENIELFTTILKNESILSKIPVRELYPIYENPHMSLALKLFLDDVISRKTGQPSLCPVQ